MNPADLKTLKQLIARANKQVLELHRFDRSEGAISWQLQFTNDQTSGEVLADGNDLFNNRCKYDFELLQALWNNREWLLSVAEQHEELELRRREGRGLLQRLVKYVREDRATTQRATRLARLVDQVADYLNRTHRPSDVLRGDGDDDKA